MSQKKAMLYNQLKSGREMGMSIPELDQKTFVSWKESELYDLTVKYFGSQAIQETIEPQEPAAQPAPVQDFMAEATKYFDEPVQDDRPRRHEWAQIAPETLARRLGVPFSDRGADRAGLTMNTHTIHDPLRVDSLGRVWFQDEVLKPAVPKARMIRKFTQRTAGVVEKASRRENGALDETFEVSDGKLRDVEIRVTLPSSQVGIYVDPRMPFKIHQYNQKRGFDYNEVRDFYGGLDLIPTRLQMKTVYIDSDLCFDMNAVRDVMEQELREKTLGRSAY